MIEALESFLFIRAGEWLTITQIRAALKSLNRLNVDSEDVRKYLQSQRAIGVVLFDPTGNKWKLIKGKICDAR